MAPALPIPPSDLRRVSSARWLAPILAEMAADGGSRFSALARSLGLSRSVLSRHLDLLESFGWIARNRGHGHPLRPEYLLTAKGAPVAAWCEAAMAQRARLGIDPSDLGRWSMPLIAELRGSWRRFSELERLLAPITPRALSLGLGKLLDVRLITRREDASLAAYGLTPRGDELASTLLSAR